jgi:CheY-like chemotaxis protein
MHLFKNFFHKKNLHLIIDDNLDNISLFQSILKIHNIKSICASSVNDAIKLFHKYPNISLIWTDLHMNPIDGKSFIHYIRNINKSIPIICITAYPNKYNYSDLINIGCNDIIEKPININSIKTIIKNFS